MVEIKVDFEKRIGKIKPLHGINNGPLIGTDEKLFPYLKEAGIPYSRLHDTGGPFGGFCYVDIENIFRDFSADPTNPESYDFAFTDWLISTLCEYGVQPFYRLGATIENSHRIKAYHIFPPEDDLKWARICEGIIRHYNEGWADGYHYGIQYWEIWNEPDNEPEIADNPMWKGDKTQYFALYKTTATYLKEHFPSIKIGGYASCGFYAILNQSSNRNANVSIRTNYFIEFFKDFLEFITADGQKVPFDFFSWHSYSGIPENIQYARYVREMLNSYGFTHTESILNEWNPGIGNRGLLKDASDIAAMMCALQKEPVDQLMYYDGQLHTPYGGMFNPITQEPFKAYYAFKAFNSIYALQNEVESISSNDDIFVCASQNDKADAVMVVNTAAEDREAKILLTDSYRNRVFDVFLLDELHNLEWTAYTDFIRPVHLPAHAVILLTHVHS